MYLFLKKKEEEEKKSPFQFGGRTLRQGLKRLEKSVLLKQVADN